jgi:HSP20 family molecular chaperone IbpA
VGVAATPCALQQQPMPSPTYELTSAADALVVKVDLPDVKKASEVDLNISATRLHLIVPPEYAATRTL